MTEAEWLAGPDRDRLLDYVAPWAAPRKLRLFVCAVGRRLWHLFADVRSRRAIEVAELLAEQPGALDAGWRAHSDLCWQTHEAALVATEVVGPDRGPPRAALLTLTAARWGILHQVKYQAAVAVNAAASGAPCEASRRGILHAERLAQVHLVRDLFGNPFHPTPLDPEWLRWQGGTVGKMARTISEQRTFAEMPILADALEDAGCQDVRVLRHCRGQGPHVRGCWVLDLLLGNA